MTAASIRFDGEMNRGFLQILVLLILEKPMYGWLIIRQLEEMAYPIEENTLYPLLRRLEKNGWITSRWSVEQDRPRKYYQIAPQGQQVRKKLLDIWNKQHQILNHFIEENLDGSNN